MALTPAGRLTRRAFLSSSLAAAAPRTRPNILFCIAGAYGARFVRTPAFDRVAGEGVLFHNAFVSTHSCCPSRSSVLAGQDFYRLRETSMNHTVWPRGLPIYPDLLSAAGYEVGYTGKGWGPGNWNASGRATSPCGPQFNRARLTPQANHISDIDYAANFDRFLSGRAPGTPFCFWVGFNEPHREYEAGAGRRHGKRLEDVVVPGFLPDVDDVRSAIADYAFETEWYDSQMQKILAKPGAARRTRQYESWQKL